MEVKIQISELFDTISELENVSFVPEKEYYQKAQIKIKDEYGNFKDVLFLMTKEDSTIQLEFDDGTKIKTAKKHRLAFNKNDCKFVDEYSVGDLVEKANGNIVSVIGLSELSKNEIVYDLNISTKNHLYQDAQGFIHHNTSFIRGYAKLLGIPLVTVEAPHITEEHIINIPFMIIKGEQIIKDSAVIETAGKTTLEDKAQSFDIVQAESNLVSKLKTMKNMKLKDQQHIATIAKDKNLRGIYSTYRKLINTVRGSYHCILFLDEYYRNDNMKIRNILRNILNGRIGNDKIPPGTFIVYASNLNDDGLEDIPMNNDFAELEFKAPDKEQWFDYILKKYEANDNKEFPNIKMNEKVFNTFYDVLDQEDLSYEDDESEVRSSPRRWEQLLLYVNENLPVSNVKEAKILMSNVEVNFRNYITGASSDLYPKIQKLMISLIKETSGVDFDGSTHPQTEWKDVLEQQLATKIKMDAHSKDTNKEVRKYIPIISGEPGIGKCLRGNQKIGVDVDEILYSKIMEIRNRNS